MCHVPCDLLVTATSSPLAMPIKFSKDVSSHLFKYIRSIDVRFNPFDGRTRSARELLRQVQSKRYSRANPSLKINIDVHDRPDAPLASFAFLDDSKQLFDTQRNNVHEILFQVHLKASQLDAEFEMSGKSVDDTLT